MNSEGRESKLKRFVRLIVIKKKTGPSPAMAIWMTVSRRESSRGQNT
jgi:hypothetical protein